MNTEENYNNTDVLTATSSKQHEKLNKILRYFVIGLCLAAFAGFFMPAIHVTMSFFGFSRTTSFSVATVFEDSGSQMGDVNIVDSEVFNMLTDNDLVRDVVPRIVISVVLYVLGLVMLLLTLLFSLLNKFIIIKTFASAMALIFIVIAGVIIRTVPALIYDSITNMLGFFALFINIQEMISIAFGAGYWIIVIALFIIGIIHSVQIGMTFFSAGEKRH